MKSSEVKRIMIIGAHPDDCELRSGGTAIKLKKAGHQVLYMSATNGDTGHHLIGGGPLARARMEEIKSSANSMNMEWCVLDIHSNELEPSVFYRKMFIKCIREFRPDIIITHRSNDYHPDHRYTSILVQDSIFGLAIPNVCPLVPCMEKMPAILYMYDAFTRPVVFTPDIIVDIDDVMDAKVKMLNFHKSQVYEWLPWINKTNENIPDNEKDRLQWLKDYQKARDGKVADKYRNLLVERYGDKGKSAASAEAFEISEYGMAISKEEFYSLYNEELL